MLENKIKKLGALKSILEKLKKQGKKIVFTNGCFDILHYGHAKYLEGAKIIGDILVVAINSDASVKKIKGPLRPMVNQKDRIRLIAALESVDYTLLFDAETPLELIKTLRPDVLAKGGDWEKSRIVGADFVRSYGGRVTTVKLVPRRSTTSMISKIAKINSS
ncbi:MAG: D-glycero-beta-D-manno-heptose 1-phosphate adenylyltransferase [Candidatus Omnitrophota bacterium]